MCENLCWYGIWHEFYLVIQGPAHLTIGINDASVPSAITTDGTIATTANTIASVMFAISNKMFTNCSSEQWLG